MMILNAEGSEPIYVQIARWLETEILRGDIEENHKIYSQYQLAEMFTINPATAAKGLTILADEGIVYKKRGLGMFVSPNAREMIRIKRKEQILKKLVTDLVSEAERLSVNEEELLQMIRSSKKRDREE